MSFKLGWLVRHCLLLAFPDGVSAIAKDKSKTSSSELSSPQYLTGYTAIGFKLKSLKGYISFSSFQNLFSFS
jgi:hypothetical protein